MYAENLNYPKYDEKIRVVSSSLEAKYDNRKRHAYFGSQNVNYKL